MTHFRRIRLTAIDPDGDELIGVTTVEISTHKSEPRNFRVVFLTEAVESQEDACVTVCFRSPSSATEDSSRTGAA